MDRVLAIDIGTTSTKGLLVTRQGNVLASHQEAYPTQYPQLHFAEQDSEEIFQAVVSIIRIIAKEHETPVISFSAAMHSLMAVDVNGKAISPLLIWADTRSIDQCLAIERTGLQQSLYEHTGTPVHPMSPLCKLLWWKENQPELLSLAHKFISIKEFVVFRLTGQFVIDYSIASATGLFNLETLSWDSLAFELHGQPIDKFSKPVPIDHIIQLSKVQCEFLYLRDATKLVIGASDGCCAQLGSEATQEGDISITVGTSGAVRKLSKSRIIDPQGRVFNYLLDKGTFVCGGATNNAAAVIKWFATNFLQRPNMSLVDFIDQTKNIEAGSEGLIFLPYLFGERAPVYDATASGVFFGASVQHTILHFQRSVAEGICFALKSILETVETATHSSRLIVSGGITYSDNWLQMLSDVLGRELMVATNYDASALGAAIIAFRAEGIEFQQKEDKATIVLPNYALSARYEKSYAVYIMLYASLKNTFRAQNQSLR